MVASRETFGLRLRSLYVGGRPLVVLGAAVWRLGSRRGAGSPDGEANPLTYGVKVAHQVSVSGPSQIRRAIRLGASSWGRPAMMATPFIRCAYVTDHVASLT